MTADSHQKMRKRNRGTLLAHLLINFLIFVPLPLVVWGIMTENALLHALSKQSLKTNQQIARSHAAAINQLGEHAQFIIESLVKDPAIRKKDPSQTEILLNLMVRHENTFESVYLLDLKGICYSSGSIIGEIFGKNYSDEPFFKEVIYTKKTAISDLRLSKISGKPVVTIASPIIDYHNRMIGVAAATLDTDRFEKEVYKKDKVPLGYLMVVSPSGKPIFPQGYQNSKYPFPMDPVIHGALMNPDGFMEFSNQNTREGFLASFASVKSLGWEIIATANKTDIFADVYRLRNLFGLGLILAALLWLGGIGWMARRVTKPLEQLTRMADQISEGEYNLPVTVKTNDELQTLAEVLSQLGSNIQSKISEIETSQKRIQTAMSEVGAALSQRYDLDAVMEFILSRIVVTLNCDFAVIFLLNEKTNKLVVETGYNPPVNMKHLVGHYELNPDEGIAGWTFTNKQSLLIPDVEEDFRYALISPFREQYPVKTLIAVPILYESNPIGVIELFSLVENGFKENDLLLAESLASQTGIAIRNARLYKQTQMQLREIQTIQEVAKVSSGTLYLDEVLNTGLQKAVEVMGMSAGSIFLVNPESTEFELRAVYGLSREEEDTEIFRKMTKPSFEKILETGEPRIISDIAKDPEVYENEKWFQRSKDLNILASATIPMSIQGISLGLLRVTSNTTHDFSASEIGMLQGIAHQLAMSLRNAELYEESQRVSNALRQSFSRIGTALASPLELPKTLELITELAAEQMDVSKSALLMLEEDHLMVQAQKGFNLEFVSNYQPGIGEGLAGWIANSRQSLILENLIQDPRCRPWEQEYFQEAVSFLGVPILFKDDLVGVLCVFSETRRQFTQEEADILITFASQASLAIENSRLYEREHFVAQTFQRSLLPQTPPKMSHHQIVTRYYPATKGLEVGGDYYDYILMKENKLGVVIADVSGKGIEAAMHGAMAKYFLRAYSTENPDPSWVLQKVNNTLAQFLPGNYFITLFYALLDLSTGKLIYANGGHEPPLIYSREGKGVTTLLPTGKLLGIFPDEKFTSQEIDLKPGDTLLLYTDGITDAQQNGRFFGIEGIQRFLAENQNLSPEETAEKLYQTVKEYQNAALRDDVALVLVHAAES